MVNRKILVVDDEPVIRKMLEKPLGESVTRFF